MKFLKWALILVAIIFTGIQFLRPARTNPPIDDTNTLSARVHVTSEVEAILNRACIDCHSHKTVWPWYSNVAPVSWLLARDVNNGRRHWNVSNWPSDPKRSAHKLEEMCEQVERGEMPLGIYLTMHPVAKLSDADKKTLCDWAKSEQQRLAVSGQATQPADQHGDNRKGAH